MGKRNRLRGLSIRDNSFETRELSLTKVVEGPGPSNQAIILIFTLIVLLAYGYQIFSYSISLDEEMYALSDQIGTARAWISQTRWAMGATAFLIPSVIGPAISVGVGVSLFALAIWRIANSFFKLSGIWLIASVSFAATYPVMIFAFEFDTIAFGLGIGFIYALFAFEFSIKQGFRAQLLAVLFFALAIATYESLSIFTLIALVAYALQTESWQVIKQSIWGLVGGFLVSKALAMILISVTGIKLDTYLNSYFQVIGLITDPTRRIGLAISDMASLYSLSEARFGLSNFWGSAVFFVLAFSAAVFAVFDALRTKKILGLIATSAAILLPSVMQLLSEWPLPLRIFIFIPAQILSLAAINRHYVMKFGAISKRTFRIVFACLAALGVLGNAAQINRVVSTSRTAYALDQQVAHDIYLEKAKAFPAQILDLVPFRMMGHIERIPTKMKPVLPSEAVGISLFGFAPGETFRVTNFLNTQGVLFSPDSTLNEELDRQLEQMPSYPTPGWAKGFNGTMLVKFSDE